MTEKEMSARQLLESIWRRAGRIEGDQKEIFQAIVSFFNLGRKIVASLDEVQKKVTDLGTAVDGVAAQVAAEGLSPANQAKVDGIDAGLTTVSGKVADLAKAVPPVPPAPPA